MKKANKKTLKTHVEKITDEKKCSRSNNKGKVPIWIWWKNLFKELPLFLVKAMNEMNAIKSKQLDLDKKYDAC